MVAVLETVTAVWNSSGFDVWSTAADLQSGAIAFFIPCQF
jgi:hypothetical protein